MSWFANFDSPSRRPAPHRYWLLPVLGGLAGVAIALSAPAGFARPAQTIWSGTGQIVSGPGQGGTVQLVLEATSNRIRTQSGPMLDIRYGGGSQTIENEAGTWQIEDRGESLDVTLYRGPQVIRYRLSPIGKGATLPQATLTKAATSDFCRSKVRV